MTVTVPRFVVVGNVNQGKSSVVAALAEDPRVPVDSYPGTTRECGRYVFRAGEETLFEIVDTPGFQAARHALAWMKQRASSPAERRAAVEAFVREHETDERFGDEVRLLRPILEGGGILYVVDASSRFQPSNEAEMEVLRWTGQPGMALLNRVHREDHSAEWRPILEQFFNVVRDFDAHAADFDDRLELLQSFRVIRNEWRAAIDHAVVALRSERASRRHRSAQVIADLIVRAVGHVERQRVAEGEELQALEKLEAAYRAVQRRLEKEARDRIEEIHGHRGMTRSGSEIEVLSSDLFSETSWRLFGLQRKQLARYGAAWGAVIGASVDLMVGGLSFFAGAGIGAGIGALSGWFAGTEVARVWSGRSAFARLLGFTDTGRFVAMGPVTSPRYVWMVLDRALYHYAMVASRSHARRDPLDLGASGADAKLGVAAALEPALRNRLDRALRAVSKAVLRGKDPGAARTDLVEVVERVLAG